MLSRRIKALLIAALIPAALAADGTAVVASRAGAPTAVTAEAPAPVGPGIHLVLMPGQSVHETRGVAVISPTVGQCRDRDGQLIVTPPSEELMAMADAGRIAVIPRVVCDAPLAWYTYGRAGALRALTELATADPRYAGLLLDLNLLEADDGARLTLFARDVAREVIGRLHKWLPVSVSPPADDDEADEHLNVKTIDYRVLADVASWLLVPIDDWRLVPAVPMTRAQLEDTVDRTVDAVGDRPWKVVFALATDGIALSTDRHDPRWLRPVPWANVGPTALRHGVTPSLHEAEARCQVSWSEKQEGRRRVYHDLIFNSPSTLATRFETIADAYASPALWGSGTDAFLQRLQHPQPMKCS